VTCDGVGVQLVETEEVAPDRRVQFRGFDVLGQVRLVGAGIAPGSRTVTSPCRAESAFAATTTRGFATAAITAVATGSAIVASTAVVGATAIAAVAAGSAACVVAAAVTGRAIRTLAATGVSTGPIRRRPVPVTELPSTVVASALPRIAVTVRSRVATTGGTGVVTSAVAGRLVALRPVAAVGPVVAAGRTRIAFTARPGVVVAVGSCIAFSAGARILASAALCAIRVGAFTAPLWPAVVSAPGGGIVTPVAALPAVVVAAIGLRAFFAFAPARPGSRSSTPEGSTLTVVVGHRKNPFIKAR